MEKYDVIVIGGGRYCGRSGGKRRKTAERAGWQEVKENASEG